MRFHYNCLFQNIFKGGTADTNSPSLSSGASSASSLNLSGTSLLCCPGLQNDTPYPSGTFHCRLYPWKHVLHGAVLEEREGRLSRLGGRRCRPLASGLVAGKDFVAAADNNGHSFPLHPFLWGTASSDSRKDVASYTVAGAGAGAARVGNPSPAVVLFCCYG